MMTPEQVSDAIYQGKTVDCAKEDYPTIRGYIQDAARKFIEWGDGLRAQIALMEVQRLDEKHDFDLFVS